MRGWRMANDFRELHLVIEFSPPQSVLVNQKTAENVHSSYPTIEFTQHSIKNTFLLVEK